MISVLDLTSFCAFLIMLCHSMTYHSTYFLCEVFLLWSCDATFIDYFFVFLNVIHVISELLTRKYSLESYPLERRNFCCYFKMYLQDWNFFGLWGECNRESCLSLQNVSIWWWKLAVTVARCNLRRGLLLSRTRTSAWAAEVDRCSFCWRLIILLFYGNT